MQASQNATGRVNVTAFVSPAQHCVVADARLDTMRRHVFDNCKDNITSDRNN